MVTGQTVQPHQQRVREFGLPNNLREVAERRAAEKLEANLPEPQASMLGRPHRSAETREKIDRGMNPYRSSDLARHLLEFRQGCR